MGIHVYFIRVTKKTISKIDDYCYRLVEFIDQQLEDEDETNYNWTEKSWEGLLLLTYDMKYFDTDKDKLARTILGGTGIYCKRYEWLTVQLQEPELVQEIYYHLKTFTKESLTKKYDSKLFSKLDIYPMKRGWKDDGIDYLLSYWDGLLKVYKVAAERDEYILLYWSI
ncbi:MAG TPA: DUF1877 family protein [Candidatus Bathyarchaeia archaeon]|nr:DUF1877 family protein [Candidatus Bathyarchaeia archaeon]